MDIMNRRSFSQVGGVSIPLRRCDQHKNLEGDLMGSAKSETQKDDQS
jgi:hypothetical protein